MINSYDPKTIESKWYQFWSDSGLFSPAVSDLPPYTIVIPPPNVTGILHMGHVLNNTLQDILIRFKRLQGHPTLWLPGTDHAGIATQNKVEQSLAASGTTKEMLGREAFVGKVWDWKEKHGGIIIQQLKRLGCSCDWSRERFTMDEQLSKAVREVFVRLYRKDLIYRGEYIINQCPRCRTAISDEEVEHRPSSGKLWHIRYPGKDGSEGIIVATTRPETMLGDMAVAVNPEDDRFRHLVGTQVILPLQNRPIPVIADSFVDKAFGTGAVKVTPAHDPNDFELARRHQLEPRLIMDPTGIMTELAGTDYQGLDRFDCRSKVLEDLKTSGYLIKEEDYQNAVGYCYRCDSVVEPYLSRQWFVRMKPLAEPARRVVEDERIVFYPERWKKVYLHWLENIRDWCISRQLWWGHRIPVWTCRSCGHIDAYSVDPETCPRCGSSSLEQDPDVLDTWFSSWLWPFSTLGWPSETTDLTRYFPTSTLITAPEIIFFWVARMIMAGLEFMGDIPFSKVYLHGTVRDLIGRKMSKSLGNSPDPLDIIDQLGADALRFSMIMISPRGSDIFFTEDTLNVGRTFANKIWNAAKFIKSNCEENDMAADPEVMNTSDRWILYRMASAGREISEMLESFRFNEAAVAIHRFLWHEFCDWYLEISKIALYDRTSPAHKKAVQANLRNVFKIALQYLHPFMPFVTEEIFSHLYPKDGSIMVTLLQDPSGWSKYARDAGEQEIVHRAVTAIRTIRSETGVPPSTQIDTVLGTAHRNLLDLLHRSQAEIAFLAKAKSVTVSESPEPPSVRATAVTQDHIDVYVDLHQIIDVPSEIKRLMKELQKIDVEITRIDQKLHNPDFISKAPLEVVEKNKRLREDAHSKRDKLQHALSLFSKENE